MFGSHKGNQRHFQAGIIPKARVPAPSPASHCCSLTVPTKLSFHCHLWADSRGLMRGRWFCQGDGAPCILLEFAPSAHLVCCPFCPMLLPSLFISMGITRCGGCDSVPMQRASKRQVKGFNFHHNLCHTIKCSHSHVCSHPTS